MHALQHKHHDEIAECGYTVVRGMLLPEEVSLYKKTAERTVEFARQGHWPDVRTRGKQFPPWPANFSPDIWGVLGLLHPGLKDEKGSLSEQFQHLYADERLLGIASDILQTPQGNLSMELFNMLINPLTDFDLDWHRDYIRAEALSEEEATELLQRPYAGTQFNLALTEDKCLIVVPGSHKRVRTEEEREKSSNSSRKEHISGQLIVELHPGDVVFYNANILHRATYSAAAQRLTLHGSYGHGDEGAFRAKGVLQHGVAKWLPDFVPVSLQMALLKEKLVRTAEMFKGQDLGYSLEG